MVVDNFSTDNSVQLLSDIISEKVEVIVSNKNGGYGAGNNYGIKYLIDKYNSDYILLSNPDVIVEDETINKLEEFLRNNQDYVKVTELVFHKVWHISQFIYIFGRYWSLQFLLAFHRHILNMNFTYSGLGKHFLYIMTMRC